MQKVENFYCFLGALYIKYRASLQKEVVEESPIPQEWGPPDLFVVEEEVKSEPESVVPKCPPPPPPTKKKPVSTI